MIRTDEQVVADAARAILAADDKESYDAACKEMVEALRYARSIEWWSQFDNHPAVRSIAEFGKGLIG